VWEDLHWIDPSSLEVLTLVLQQVPTSRVLAVLTYRPDFTPPWRAWAHSTQLTLNRLGPQQITAMVNQVTAKAVLSTEIIQQIVSKTDGVPLFVEELTKSVLESVGATGRSSLQALDIPATLQDSLMARLDRLGTAKTIAQLGATLGREFSYDLLQAVSPVDATALQHSLQQLVNAELLYQRGLLPQAMYLFKHALIQDTAYQSLLKSKRQQYHHQIAQVFEERFPETRETQPELVAHHYTESGLRAQAIPYWQRAGERATQRSAYVEAVAHLNKGLELLKTLPDTPEHVQQELTLQITLGTTLIVTKGYAAPEVEHSFARALELCRQLGEMPQLLLVLGGLYTFHFLRAELQMARELAEQQLRLAQSLQDPALLLAPHVGLGLVLCNLGESTAALLHLERGIALYDPPKHRPDRSQVYGQDPKVTCLSYAAVILWTLGYPNQARKRITEALTLARELSHRFSLAFALNLAAALDQYLRDGQAALEQTKALLALAHEQGFPHWLPLGAIRQGWALAELGQAKEGLAGMRQGRETMQAMGAVLNMPLNLAWLAEGYGKTGQAEEGLTLLAEALELVQKTGERRWEAELYRLKGELTLTQSSVPSLESSLQKEAERCFQKAIEVARKQQAKSLELRATMSLVRLRQQQILDHGLRISDDATRTTHHEARYKLNEAHEMLAEIYGWFTEGFDTKDLQEAKALLDELSERG
jgi:predicted ATPase